MTEQKLNELGFKRGNWLDSDNPHEQIEIHKRLENLGVSMYLSTETRLASLSGFDQYSRYLFYQKDKGVYFLRANYKDHILMPEFALTYEEFKSIIASRSKFIDNSYSKDNTILDQQLKKYNYGKFRIFRKNRKI